MGCGASKGDGADAGSSVVGSGAAGGQNDRLHSSGGFAIPGLEPGPVEQSSIVEPPPPVLSEAEQRDEIVEGESSARRWCQSACAPPLTPPPPLKDISKRTPGRGCRQTDSTARG